jgi:hypothetical protein
MPEGPTALPDRFRDVEHLESVMTAPSAAVTAELGALAGDLIILGVGGKIGPTLAALAKRAAPQKRVIGVARFSEAGLREKLTDWGVECIAADLLDRKQIERLPKAANVIFMAGRKFGSSGNEDLTWAMNAHGPALVAEAFAGCMAAPPKRRRPFRRPASMPIPVWRAKPCSSSSRARVGRPAGSFASTMQSTCATACCTTSQPACMPGSRST